MGVAFTNKAAGRLGQSWVYRNNRIYPAANGSISKGSVFQEKGCDFLEIAGNSEGGSETSPQVTL